jgi:transposase-like protein
MSNPVNNPFRYFNSSPEVIGLVVMMYVRYPLSLRNVEDLLAERGIEISHETVRFWWNRFGPMFAAEIRKRRVARMRGYPQWRWDLDEVFVKINGKLCHLWRAVDHEGEVLETVVTAKRDKAAALKSLKRIMKKYGRPRIVVICKAAWLKSQSAMGWLRATESAPSFAPSLGVAPHGSWIRPPVSWICGDLGRRELRPVSQHRVHDDRKAASQSNSRFAHR